MQVYGHVVVPEHVHLLISEPYQKKLDETLKSLKQGVSRRLMGMRSVSGRSVTTISTSNHRQFVEELRYIHRNPVKRGLCECPEDWSSFRHIMRRDMKGVSRLSRSGRRESGNERQDGFSQPSNCCNARAALSVPARRDAEDAASRSALIPTEKFAQDGKDHQWRTASG